ALRSTIPNANLYFLNPAGVIFGANASLDVQGSFHASTADYLGLVDGTRFSAISPGDNQVLTTAAPEAFGFLGDNPNTITLAQAELKVPSGESLSVIGGNINLEGGQLIALGGRIDIASVSSRGEVVRQDNDLSLNGFEQLGKIELTQVEKVARVKASGESGGAIFIRGGELILNDSVIESKTFGRSPGKAIDITLPEGSLEIRDGGAIATTTRGAGKGGDLIVEAQNITINREGSEFTTGLVSESNSTGDGGNIEVTTESLEVVNGAEISAITRDTGDAGNVSLEADSVFLSGDGDFLTGVFTKTKSSGDAGDLSLQSNSIEVDSGANITTSTSGSGDGGILFVKAGKVLMSGGLSRISALAFDKGDSKNVTINTDSLMMSDGAIISTISTGKSASLLIDAKQMQIMGNKTRIFAGAAGGGDSNDATIKTGSLEMRDGATIQATSVNSTGETASLSIYADQMRMLGKGTVIIAGANGANTGVSKDVTIKTNSLEIRNGAFILSTSSESSDDGANILIESGNILLTGDGSESITGIGSGANNDTGNVGNITLIAENLEIRDKATVSSLTAETGNSGDILVRARNILLSGDGRLFSNTFRGSTGDAGKINITADNIEIRNGSEISTDTFGSGKGGDITIEADNMLLSGNDVDGLTGVRSFADGTGDAGNLTITANDSLILDNALVSTQTRSSNGGNINISTDKLLQLHDSDVSTSVFFDNGASGNIKIGQDFDGEGRAHRPNVIVLDNSQIVARTAGGNSGTISITSDFIFRTENSLVDASSRTGSGGEVSINSPETNMSGSIIALPETFINTSEHLSQRCTARSANLSSFVVKDRSGIPPGPEDAASSTYFDRSQWGLSNGVMDTSNHATENSLLVAANAHKYISSTISNQSNNMLTQADIDCME
ncbi:MAG: hypothetical protein V3V18_02695, partial [Methylococcales bacterium]